MTNPIPGEPVVVGGDELKHLLDMIADGKAPIDALRSAALDLAATSVPMVETAAVFGPNRKMDENWLSLSQAARVISSVIRQEEGDKAYTMVATKKRAVEGALRAYMTPYGRVIHLSDLISFLYNEYPERRAQLEAML